jgi:putative membrane protein
MSEAGGRDRTAIPRVETWCSAIELRPRCVVSVAAVDARRVALGAGLALVAIALLPPLHDLSFDALVMHLLQNVLLAEWAPLLLVLGLEPQIARRLADRISPWWGLPLWVGTYYLWHAPPLYDAALRNPSSLLQLEHVCYLAAGLVFWLPLVHGRQTDGAKAAYVFAAFLAMSPLGLLLALLPRAVYDFYDGHWGLSALADQQLAGIAMSSAEAIVFFAAFAFYVSRAMRESS